MGAFGINTELFLLQVSLCALPFVLLGGLGLLYRKTIGKKRHAEKSFKPDD